MYFSLLLTMLHLHLFVNSALKRKCVCLEEKKKGKVSHKSISYFVVGDCKYMAAVNSWIYSCAKENSLGIYLSIFCPSINISFYQKNA